jgi:hypothetical protein
MVGNGTNMAASICIRYSMLMAEPICSRYSMFKPEVEISLFFIVEFSHGWVISFIIIFQTTFGYLFMEILKIDDNNMFMLKPGIVS